MNVSEEKTAADWIAHYQALAASMPKVQEPVAASGCSVETFVQTLSDSYSEPVSPEFQAALDRVKLQF